MEQNLPIVAKKFWNIVRVIYFMVRKGIISKGKLLADLNALMKRGKIAGKAAVHALVFQHHRRFAAVVGGADGDRRLSFPDADRPGEYEFSCSSTPHFGLPFNLGRRVRGQGKAAPTIDGELAAAVLEMIESAAASPALPGFGRTPAVRQLRITDSPFPASWDAEGEGSNYPVDEAAEEFIMRFYRDLRRQNDVARLGCS
ncbi:Avr9/Cf-9 rapidly elicited protein 146 [Striga asiatica]|uniref:Avr9/Cf-9 rapidly elicited protein 146 n=1 Tax=Striga asiatica TaxID=4170 RepID=A0A5A7R421_STRAF|nr:Avr9/Cf-9 rapidly elicited protein 146 [Striga asiatica]